ncbi:MAG: hypothetical protein ACKO96_32750, partial [Flammeovirgaceae bacterium]
EQKAKAEQDILTRLGEYKVAEKQEAYTKTEDTPTDWSTGLTGLGEMIVGSIATGAGVAGGILAGWTGAGAFAGAALASAGATTAYIGTEDFAQGFYGQKTVDVPEKIVKSTGLVTK